MAEPKRARRVRAAAARLARREDVRVEPLLLALADKLLLLLAPPRGEGRGNGGGEDDRVARSWSRGKIPPKHPGATYTLPTVPDADRDLQRPGEDHYTYVNRLALQTAERGDTVEEVYPYNARAQALEASRRLTEEGRVDALAREAARILTEGSGSASSSTQPPQAFRRTPHQTQRTLSKLRRRKPRRRALYHQPQRYWSHTRQ